MTNAKGDPYPQITDPRTGWPVNYPGDGYSVVPKPDRVVWDGPARAAYIKEWYDRGYGDLPGSWSDYDIHHILPREYGGSNDFNNLVPLLRQQEHVPFSSWWRNY